MLLHDMLMPGNVYSAGECIDEIVGEGAISVKCLPNVVANWRAKGGEADRKVPG